MRILLILLLPIHLFAGAHYCDSGASGANDGSSWADAWESLGDVVFGGGGVTAGDTLYISGGTDSTVYNESFDVTDSGTDGNPIVIMCGTDASHNGKVVITSNVTITGEDYVTLYGGTTYEIKVRGTSGDGITCNNTTEAIIDGVEVGPWSGDDGISFDEYDGGGNVIKNCKIHDIYDYSIIVNRPAADEAAPYVNDDHLTIDNNEIYNLGHDAIHAAAFAGGLTIKNNTIHTQMVGDGVNYNSSYVDGMQLRGWKYLTVESNVIYNLWSTDGVNAYIFLECDVAQQSDTRAQYIYVYNNVIFETDHTTNAAQNSKGIEFKPIACGALRDVEVANNTIIDTRVWGIEAHEFSSLISDSVENVRFVNNLIYNNDQRTGGSGNRLSFVLHELNATLTTGSVGDAVDIIWDYNLVDALNGTATCRYGGPGTGTLMDYSAFNAASGCDDNGVEADPSFTNYTENSVTAATDVQLSGADNTSREAGTTSTIFSVDYNDVSRPQSTNWDIGAWEKVTAPTPPVEGALVPGGSGLIIPGGSGQIIVE